jgi:eukaryotic sulfide quinone oxidoreductase
MYLADDYWRTQGVRGDIDVEFVSAVGKIFAVDKYAQRLSELCDSRELKRSFLECLVAVDHTKKQATFAKMVDGKPSADQTTVRDFDLLHVGPPMGPIASLAKSPLANAAGWIDVNQHTLQHTKYPNVFSLGDCSSVPTSKTAAAVAGQTGVLKANLRAAMAGLKPSASYDGYTSCPLVTGRNSLMLAEFNGFTATPMETFPYDQGNPTSFAYWLKAEAMPYIYWEMLLKDQWNGVSQYRSLFAPFKDQSQNTNPTA